MKKSFEPSNTLTFDTVNADRKRLLKCLQDEHTLSLHVNLSQVTQCDSAGLALLIEAKRLGLQYNKHLEIDGMPKAIQALVEFCGVEAVLA